MRIPLATREITPRNVIVRGHQPPAREIRITILFRWPRVDIRVPFI